MKMQVEDLFIETRRSAMYDSRNSLPQTVPVWTTHDCRPLDVLLRVFVFGFFSLSLGLMNCVKECGSTRK